MNRFFDFFKKIRLPKIVLPKIARFSTRQIIFWAVALALAVGLFLFGRSLTICWRLTSLPGIPPPSCAGAAVNPLGTPIVNEQGTPMSSAGLPTPAAAVPEVQYPQWDGASRINILFIGLDYRDWLANEGPPRSDTMILFTVDPVTRTAGMLSIPRDMWVNIPGFGYSRINTAYSSGEGNKLPGGGPGLAMKTVEQFVGVPVHYYAQVDFNTFADLIDLIGCIKIEPDERLVLDPIGPGDDHLVVTPGGLRTFCGRKALSFARTRKTEGGDVDRAHRQQQVIFAIRDKVFSPEEFPKLIAQAPEIYNRLSAGIHTNMSLDDAIKLAVLVKDIPLENIKTGVIDYDMTVLDSVILDGQKASILKPIPDKIRVLRDEIFTSGGALSPIASGDPLALMQADGARVRVLNGTYTAQLDARTANFLLSQGMQVTAVGNADRLYNQTVIVLYSPKLYALRYLWTTFGLTSNSQLLVKNDPASTVDVEIRIGTDWLSKIPAGF